MPNHHLYLLFWISSNLIGFSLFLSVSGRFGLFFNRFRTVLHNFRTVLFAFSHRGATAVPQRHRDAAMAAWRRHTASPSLPQPWFPGALTETSAREMFRKADLDQSGRIEIDELESLIDPLFNHCSRTPGLGADRG